MSIKANVTLMRKIARQVWSEVQSQETLTNGVIRFNTSSHGGYIVDSLVYPKVKDIPNIQKYMEIPYIRFNKYNNIIPSYYTKDENRFYVFEEDCNWAILLHYCKDLLDLEWEKNKDWLSQNSKFKTKDLYAEYVKGICERWENGN